jgi:hypothetical protein
LSSARRKSGSTSRYDQDASLSSAQRSKFNRCPRAYDIALIALDPPITRPRGHGIGVRRGPSSGSVVYAQSTSVPTSVVHCPGCSMAGLAPRPPASMSSTRVSRSALSRLASTQPDDPAPMTMKSNSAAGPSCAKDSVRPRGRGAEQHRGLPNELTACFHRNNGNGTPRVNER